MLQHALAQVHEGKTTTCLWCVSPCPHTAKGKGASADNAAEEEEEEQGFTLKPFEKSV